MKEFSFSFQYLLDAHRAKEQAAEHALHMAVATLAEIEGTFKSMTESRGNKIAAFEKMQGMGSRADYADYVAYVHRIEYIDQELDGLETERCTRSQVVEECRAALRKEVTSRRILENLSEREKTEWAELFQSEEQKQMDELAVVRWSRQER